ncbi:urotensin-related peptide 1 [Trichomycterus rosablanca]|uniref:urotensin-related peptide 1 n=1 Tax=Trichomycterus rosablanca TaxID=2290929 RepID=UPI002F36019E
MPSVVLLYMLAVLFHAANALPLYPDDALAPQEEVLRKLVSEVVEVPDDDPSAQKDIKSIFPLVLQHERDRDSWKEAKETPRHEKANNMVDDLKMMVLKLAAADNLRSQGYVRSNQNLAKPNKRACFWKYCVTN